MERRVLIVESQNEFALSMASVLKDAGYQTAMANNAADALRELFDSLDEADILKVTGLPPAPATSTAKSTTGQQAAAASATARP